MAEELHKMINKKVTVMANDGRIFIGMLRGIDQVTNVILEDVEERIFSMTQDMEIERYDVYLLRGDDVAIVAIYNDEKDNEMEWKGVRVDPLGPIVHLDVFFKYKFSE